MGPQTTSADRLGSHGAISVKNVSKIFQGRKKASHFIALDRVHMTVEPGEFVCLLGPSGCGKSTLLHIVAGLLEPSDGEIYVDDTLIRGPGPDRGLLFQQASLFPWLTVIDNVMFGPKAQHKDRKEARILGRELLANVGLAQFETSYPHELSGGMQHRVAFARALINQPSVLLLDEPFAALDAITRMEMQSFLLELWGDYGMTILFVTHDISEAATLADRVMVMSTHPGRLHQTVDVQLPRPRTPAVIESEACLEVRKELRSSVAGVLAADRQFRTASDRSSEQAGNVSDRIVPS